MESVFLNLIRGNRVSSYLGLESPCLPKYGSLYQYIEIPLLCFRKDDGTELEKASANQHLEVVPNCTIKVRGNQPVLVSYNPELQKYCSMAGSHIVWPGGERHTPSFYVNFRKGVEVGDIEWAVRLSLLA